MSSRRRSDGGPLPFIAILSIDGGGIRGIIAAVILNYLESELKRLDVEDGGDGEDVRIANYFHTIAGTSTGGLITVILTCPNEEGGPLFTAKEILDFYLEESPKIFPQPRVRIWGLHDLMEAIRCLRGPKYDGKHLHSLMRKLLGKKRLRDTLTNVVIVTYDIKLSKEMTFLSHELKKSAKQDALLSDICISTSAAPIYLPSHKFHTSITEFNLIDGGVIANNPILPAMVETEKEVKKGTTNETKAATLGNFLILSIGTGTKFQKGYSAQESAKWGFFKWLYNCRRGDSPLLNILEGGKNAMVDAIHHAYIKNHLNAHHLYLWIEDDTLDGDKSSLDLATKKNLRDLVRVGEDLLGKRVSLENGLSTAYSGITNAQALKRFAKFLHEGKKCQSARNLKVGEELLPKLISSRDIEIEPGFRILF